jgi:membrane-associated protein
MDLISLIKTVGYAGVFLVIFIESGVFFGFFFPGDSLLFTAGFLASQGFMNIWVLIIGVVISAVAGVSVGYAFGFKIGPMIFKREDSLFFHKDNLVHTQHFYEQYGKKAIILARFMPGIRTFAPILAGVGKMNYSVFFLYNVIGGLLWGAGLSLSGYYLGNTIPNIDKYILPIILLIIFVSVLPTFIHIFKEKSAREKAMKLIKNMMPGKNKKILALNWKMNPESLTEALVIAKSSDHKNAIVIPPSIFISEVARILKRAKLGAQDVFYKEVEKGPYTGAVSAKELKNLDVKYVIVGHSEKRAMGETDELISQKIKTVLDNDMIPILCVGENLIQHKNGSTKKILEDQLKSDLVLIDDLKKQIIIAYEPIWAIGSGNPETPENAVETINYIKSSIKKEHPYLDIKVFYGGSVVSQNIADFLKRKEIDGVLIGGASLKPETIFK